MKGRPTPEAETMVKVTLYVEKALRDRIDRLAVKHRMDRSKLTRNLLVCGLEDAEVMDKLGFLTMMAEWETIRDRIVGRKSPEEEAMDSELDGSVCFT